MATTQNAKPTKVVTGKVRFSYANVWEPKQMMENGKPVGKPKYSVVLLIPKKNKADIKRIEDAIAVAKELGKASTWKGKIPAGLKMPLHDGDEKFNEDPEKYAPYEGMVYLSAKSDTKPGIIDKAGNEIIERDEFYSGCYGKASVNFYPFDNVSKGIGCGLNNLMKTEDGENLGGGRAAATEDFADDISADEDDL